MSTVRELHRQAMELANEAAVARVEGRAQDAAEIAQAATDLEFQAASLVPNEPSSEPTRSILYRSAASLAAQAGNLRLAQRLIGEGLAGFPPPSVEDELKTLLDDIGFRAHLQVKGWTLAHGEIQISMVGAGIANGLADYQTVATRIESAIRALRNTARRIADRPFSSRANLKSDWLYPLISAPRAGSFAVTIAAAERGQTSYLRTPDDVIGEFLACMELVDSQNWSELHDRIPDDRYYLSFSSDARMIAPDGEEVALVGLTSNNRELRLETVSADLPPPLLTLPSPVIYETLHEVVAPTRVTAVGTVDLAHRTENEIGLKLSDGTNVTMGVHEGLDEFVRSFWGQLVEVDYEDFGRHRRFIDLRSASQLEDETES